MFNALYPSIIIISFFLLFFGYKFIKGHISVMHFFYWIIFSVYIASLVVYTLFPFPYQKELIEIMIEDNLGVYHNLIPFKAFVDAINMGSLTIAIKQIGGNILLFMPLGFALPILFPVIKKGKVILTGFLVSLTIELVQAIAGVFLGYNYRSFDVDDLIMNTLGTVIGLLVFNLLSNFLKQSGLLISRETKI
jgi:glycopeptide antibiotics resistance protein